MEFFTSTQQQRYSRQFLLPEIGVSGQKLLLSSKVLVIGAGGLGSSALMHLAGAGVGTIGIADNDNVELSNLHRQIIHNTTSLGEKKTQSAKRTIEALNPDVSVRLHNERVTVDNISEIIRGYDFIIDGSDNFETKFLINDACVLEHKPYSHAGAVRFGGQAMTYVPQKGPCLRCLLGSIPPADEACSCSSAGVLGVVPGIMGSIQALEAIKYLLGIPELLIGKILSFDGLHMHIRTTKIPNASAGCAVCGTHPSIVSLYENKADYEAKKTCSSKGV